MLGMKWKSYSCVKDEAFFCASKRLNTMFQPQNKPRNVDNMSQFASALTKIAEALNQKKKILKKAATVATT